MSRFASRNWGRRRRGMGRLTVAIAVVATAILAIGVADTAAAIAAPTTAAGKTSTSHFQFMSTSRYSSLYGQARLDAALRKYHSTIAGSSRVPSGVTPAGSPKSGYWYTILSRPRDAQGYDVPIRIGKSDSQNVGGDSGAGYNHACVDHNLCNMNAFNATFSGTRSNGTGGSDRYRYQEVIVDNNLNLEMLLTAYTSRARNGFGAPTPDGDYFGLITEYCEGYTICPNWVNSV